MSLTLTPSTPGTLSDAGPRWITGSAVPTDGDGVVAAIGSLYTSTVNGNIWSKTGSADTDWSPVAFA